MSKPLIGITCGDINGIGTELFIRTFSDNRMAEFCVPVFFGSGKLVNFYKKAFPNINLNWQNIKDFSRVNPKQLNIYNCWDEEITITPGQLNETGAKYATVALRTAVEALSKNEIHGLVTSPIHKKNVQAVDFNYTGHTPFLKEVFKVSEAVMVLFSGDFRVALLSEHIPVNEIASQITRENIIRKLTIMNESLKQDFGIEKPKIAVLGLNPHAGDDGLVGKEEELIIRPALKEAKQNNLLVMGPYSADGFFGKLHHEKFDAVLAMYHDQGLIPFKALASGSGVNFTAGLPVVRTSPDHGTAFDIAGKGIADESSFRTAVFECINIINRRKDYAEARKDPLKKITSAMMAGAEDEKLEDGE